MRTETETDHWYTPVEIVRDIVGMNDDLAWLDLTTCPEAQQRLDDAGVPIVPIYGIDATADDLAYLSDPDQALFCNPPYSRKPGAQAFIRALAPRFQTAVFLLNYDVWVPRIAREIADAHSSVWLGLPTKRISFDPGLGMKASGPKKPQALIVKKRLLSGLWLPDELGGIPMVWAEVKR